MLSRFLVLSILMVWAVACKAPSEEVLKKYPTGEKQEAVEYSGSGPERQIISRTGYYRDGTIAFEEHLEKGAPVTFTEYYPNGNLKSRKLLDSDGAVSSASYFDSDGARQLTSDEIADIIASLAQYAGPQAAAEDVATMETSAGTIRLRLYTDVAPGHSNNFKKLANSGFYDSTTFHRIVPGFVIQGGDINSRDNDRQNDSSGSPGYSIDAEFNPRPHVKGTLAMARAKDPNSAGSQFYIALDRLTRLDNNYTVFGEVIEGLEVVDAIAGAPRDKQDNPINPQRIYRVRVE